METLGSPPRARSVDPRLYAPLAGFTCGDATPHEQEVNTIVHALYGGHAPGIIVRVAEDEGTGEFLGLCGIAARPLVLAPPHLPMPDAAYTAVIGIPLSCRGKYRLPDGRRVGEFLLDDALEVVHRVWGGGSMPPVWALITPANQASHDLFANRGFGHIPGGPHTDNHDIRLRGRALPLR